MKLDQDAGQKVMFFLISTRTFYLYQMRKQLSEGLKITKIGFLTSNEIETSQRWENLVVNMR